MAEQLVIFQLDYQFYGINIASVEGIIKIQEINRVAKMPVTIEGITDLRGLSVPVIDLRKRFNLAAGEYTADTRIIVVSMAEMKIGMIVDSVLEVMRVDQDSISAVPPVVATVDTQFIDGIARIGEKLISILNLENMLNSKETKSLQKFLTKVAQLDRCINV